MRGGHANSGPAPDPSALRRNRPSDQAGWIHVPDHREESAPAWPLTRPTAREAAIWAEEWHRGQAVLWEQNGWQREVALYVRALVVAEKPRARTDERRLVRQFMEGLGISAEGLRRNRWIIDSTPEPARLAATGTEAPSAKRRLELLRD